MTLFDAVLENVYTGPVRERLEYRLKGWFKITGAELSSSYAYSQDAFIGVLTARMEAMLDRMVDVAKGVDAVKDYSHERGEFPRIRPKPFFTVDGKRYLGKRSDVGYHAATFRRMD